MTIFYESHSLLCCYDRMQTYILSMAKHVVKTQVSRLNLCWCLLHYKAEYWTLTFYVIWHAFQQSQSLLDRYTCLKIISIMDNNGYGMLNIKNGSEVLARSLKILQYAYAQIKILDLSKVLFKQLSSMVSFSLSLTYELRKLQSNWSSNKGMKVPLYQSASSCSETQLSCPTYKRPFLMPLLIRNQA